jgi:hypothetical protein
MAQLYQTCSYITQKWYSSIAMRLVGTSKFGTRTRKKEQITNNIQFINTTDWNKFGNVNRMKAEYSNS